MMDLFKFKDKTVVHSNGAVAISTVKSKVVLIATLSLSVIVLGVVFFSFSDTTPTFSETSSRVSEATLPSLDTLNLARATTLDAAPNITDFNQRLTAIDNRLLPLEQAVEQFSAQLVEHNNAWAMQLKELVAKIADLTEQFTQLANTNHSLSESVSEMQHKLAQNEESLAQKFQSDLPMHGLSLLSVSIWDDGVVAIVSLGTRMTSLSEGDFFAGLKVEAMSVAEQSLTLYQPTTDKLYKLYADSIVYKEITNDD